MWAPALSMWRKEESSPVKRSALTGPIFAHAPSVTAVTDDRLRGPCGGSSITNRLSGTVPVIDGGPYVAGREFD
jgi:hypothetical protein